MLMQDLLHQWWMGCPKSCRQAQAWPHQALRQLAQPVGHQMSTWTVLHQLATCESDCVTYEHQCGAQKAQMWRRALEREAIERRHVDEQALLDRRRRDLESATDPTVPKELKGPSTVV